MNNTNWSKNKKITVLYVGESWLGSCARSMKEALSRNTQIQVDEIAEDAYFPRAKGTMLRVVNRLLRPAYRRELENRIIQRLVVSKADYFITYKGLSLQRSLIKRIRNMGIFTVNIYPDCSPNVHGAMHRDAVGTYDLVISTKAYHPENWQFMYGYENQCTFVPQGYDPLLHLVTEPPTNYDFDIVLIATFREEYGNLIVNLSRKLNKRKLRVLIGGYGWHKVASELPAHWALCGAVHGQNYLHLLRSGKVCIAPLTQKMSYKGEDQLGDVDTTRSYELAAASCFFIHRKTDFVAELYKGTGVPLFEDAVDLADSINYYLDHEDERTAIAEAAHRAIVPRHSLDTRAIEIISELKRMRSI